MLNLRGRGALITGTRRIGATVVERMAREGIRPAIVYRRSRQEADRLYDSIRGSVDRACVYAGAAALGRPLEEHVAFVIAALVPIAEEIGL